MTVSNATVSDATIRKIRAPQEPNTALIEPAHFLLADVLKNNAQCLASAGRTDIAGISLKALTIMARQHLLQSAVQFTSQYQNVSGYTHFHAHGIPQTFILSGHQPELFHPGVWFKNVALSQWSREHNAVAIQLIIDSDLCRRTSIRVPTGTLDDPRVVDVSFDTQRSIGSHLAIPYEERPIQDANQFASFDRRVALTIESFVPNPLVSKLWPFARAAARSGASLGQAIAQSRHRLERSWGLESLELPWSSVCDTDAFRRFVIEILRRLSEFQSTHNEVLREYRAARKIRGRARPVAPLVTVDGWMEMPFWCWWTTDTTNTTSIDPRRRALWARAVSDGWELRADGTDQIFKLDQNVDTALGQLALTREQGFKVRSRALLTTMYARLVLSNLFLHGIGGAKYDELTDEIIRRFWHIEPPKYVVLSATVPLPITCPTAEVDDLRRTNGILRDLWFHPENHLGDANADCTRLLKEKKQWIDKVPVSLKLNPDWAKQRHDGIVSTTASLRERVTSLRELLLEERRHLVQQLQRSALLSSREYSFSLFPENRLRQTLLDLLD